METILITIKTIDGEAERRAQEKYLEIWGKVLNHLTGIYKQSLYSRIRQMLEKGHLSQALPSTHGGQSQAEDIEDKKAAACEVAREAWFAQVAWVMTRTYIPNVFFILILFFFSFIFISWRLITSQYWHSFP